MSAESSRSKTTTLWCMDFANYFRFTVSKWTCHSQLSSRKAGWITVEGVSVVEPDF